MRDPTDDMFPPNFETHAELRAWHEARYNLNFDRDFSLFLTVLIYAAIPTLFWWFR